MVGDKNNKKETIMNTSLKSKITLRNVNVLDAAIFSKTLSLGSHAVSFTRDDKGNHVALTLDSKLGL